MTKRFVSLLLVLFLAASAQAQAPSSLPERLLARFGETVDLAHDPTLRKELFDRGVIAASAKTVTLDRAFLTKLAGNEAFWNEVHRIRYHVGDRVFVKTTNADGEARITHRAEITRIENGTYTVETWDETGVADPTERVDPATGRHPGDTTRAPRKNVRTLQLTHEQVDELNGFVDPGHGGDYAVFGLPGGRYADYGPDVDLVSPTKDPTLREALAWTHARIDALIESGDLALTLAGDSKAALAKIAAAQRKLILEIFDRFNITGEPGYPDGSTGLLDGKRLVGSFYDAMKATCTSKAEWMTALLREAGRRAGFDVRGTRTAMHSAMTIRTADGERYMMDPHWAGALSLATVDHVDRNFVRFADAGPREDDRTTFQDDAARASLLRGVAPGFASRLAAAERTPRGTGLTEALGERMRDGARGESPDER